MISPWRLVELRGTADRAIRAATEADGPRFGGPVSTGWQTTVIELLDEVDRLTRELAAAEVVRVAAQEVDDRHQNGVGGALWWAALDRLTFALTDVPDDEPERTHDGIRIDKAIHPRAECAHSWRADFGDLTAPRGCKKCANCGRIESDDT